MASSNRVGQLPADDHDNLMQPDKQDWEQLQHFEDSTDIDGYPPVNWDDAVRKEMPNLFSIGYNDVKVKKILLE